MADESLFVTSFDPTPRERPKKKYRAKTTASDISDYNVTLYDPTPKAEYEQFVEPESSPMRETSKYQEYVIDPKPDYGRRERKRESRMKAKTKRKSDDVEKGKALKYDDYTPDDDETLSDEVYIVRQNVGYCSILFSVVQVVILIVMMVKCGIAPLRINPMVGPYPDVLSEWGAKNTVLILEDGQWYRLISPILLHAGIIHLLCNVAVQLETGVFFEKEWGSARWLAIYLVSAIGSSILSVIAMPDALSVGSSGAVMGLFGAKLSEVVMRACERIRTKQDRVANQVRKEQCCAVSCSVIVIMLFSFIPYVDWAAHLGGLLAGIFVGIFIFACEIESKLWRVLWHLLGMAAVVISFTVALDYMYSGSIEPIPELRDVCAYYQEALGEYECQCQRAA